jgi:cytochrome P450
MRLSVEGVVERQLDALARALKEGPADFTEIVSEEIPVLTIGEWMGIPPSDYPLLRSLTHDQVFTQELFPTASEISISDAATARLRSYFSHLVSERRRTLGTDPISSWIHHWDAVEPGEAADEAVRSLALFMVLAALETSSHLLANVVRLLIEHPQQCHELQDNADLVPDAIEEALRFDAPIHMITRIAATPTEVGGRLVNAGEIVHLMIGSAHHDPQHFNEPDQFDIRRRLDRKGPVGHLGFGAGIHYCLGNALARVEAEALLKALLRRRMTNLRIHTPPTWAPRVVFRRMTSLIVAAV